MEDQKKFIDIHNLASPVKLDDPQALSDIEVILLAVWVRDTLGKGKQVLYFFLPRSTLDPPTPVLDPATVEPIVTTGRRAKEKRRCRHSETHSGVPYHTAGKLVNIPSHLAVCLI